MVTCIQLKLWNSYDVNDVVVKLLAIEIEILRLQMTVSNLVSGVCSNPFTVYQFPWKQLNFIVRSPFRA